MHILVDLRSILQYFLQLKFQMTNEDNLSERQFFRISRREKGLV